MRTLKIDLFKASELSGPALTQVLKDYREINLDRHIWKNTFYEEAEEVGILISDDGIDFTDSIAEVITRILDKYPVGSDGFALGTKYEYTFTDDYDEDDVLEFKKDISAYYDGMVDKIFTDKKDVMMNDDAIIITLDNNGYEFTSNGSLYTVITESEWLEIGDTGPRVTIIQV